VSVLNHPWSRGTVVGYVLGLILRPCLISQPPSCCSTRQLRIPSLNPNWTRTIMKTTLVSCNLRPKGSVLIRHATPRRTPDLQNMVELVKCVRRIGKTSPLSDIIGVWHIHLDLRQYVHKLIHVLFWLFLRDLAAREHNPGPEIQTDEELVAWVKQYTNSIARTPLSLILSFSLRRVLRVFYYPDDAC
jgi:hypothetical protein